MSTPNRSESQQVRSQEETSSGPGRGFLWALGGIALAGAGVAALLYFTSENENNTGPRVALVEDHLRENVTEVFRTRNISQEDCNVCLEPLKRENVSNDQSYMLRCGHIFHQACIESWLKTRERNGQCPNCPACRAPDPTNILGQNLHPNCR